MSKPHNPKLDIIKKTRNVLRGEWSSSADLKQLYEDLEELDQFAYAADVLLKRINQDESNGTPLSINDYQKLAKYIYKDQSLPSSFKFDRAFRILNAHDDLTKTERCETLGLAGAIFKYKWFYDHQSINLDRSIDFYRRGYLSWQKWLGLNASDRITYKYLNDDGYTAINYSYMLELQAIDQLNSLGSSIDLYEKVQARLNLSNEIRNFILEVFIEGRKEAPVDEKKKWTKLKQTDYDSWVYATIAEAFLGLKDYEAAQVMIQLYKEKELEDVNKKSEKPVDEKVLAWKIRTFSRQLLSIAHLQKSLLKLSLLKKASQSKLDLLTTGINEVGLKNCLSTLVAAKTDDKVEEKVVEQSAEGKTGIALSGGGFRASLFHIGVLAALAEHDRLKDMEVISCVSGGSILGAFYYIKLRQILQTKDDNQIERGDYIQLIKELEQEFLNGVQKNLRMRILSNLPCNLRMIFDSRYSRTHRLGELYEEFLYRKIIDDKEIYINKLKIEPKGEQNFSITTDNWKRRNKIPQLILNATSVNTGHNWQFAATWMGEPPGSIQADIDVKPRLRRMYYDDAPAPYDNFRLGYAVGASSCVPVMFTPMPMKNLFPGIHLQLIDGGLHDNQGIAALIEQECKNMVISDASGQMPTTIEEEKNELSVFYRADTILQERLRELQFKDLKERKATSQLSSLHTVHLKNDLQQPPISWKDCTDPPRAIYDDMTQADPNELTTYGVLRTVQQLLSEIRTDLDSFSEVEAYALMYSAYQQTHYELTRSGAANLKKDDRENTWKFLSIEKHMTDPATSRKISKVLETAKEVPFKVLNLYKSIRVGVYIIGILLALAFFYWGIKNWNCAIWFPIPIKTLVWTFLILIVGAVISKTIASILDVKTFIKKRALLLLVMVVMWIVSNLYLFIFNPLYNRAGRMKNFK